MELCTQLEADLLPAMRNPNAIVPMVQVLSVLHFLATGSFQFTVGLAAGMSQLMFSIVLWDVLSAFQKHLDSYIRFPQPAELATVKADFYELGHIRHVIGAIDGTHIALVLPSANKQVYQNLKSFHSINVQMVCLPDQYISKVTAKFRGSVLDVLHNEEQHYPKHDGPASTHTGDSGYPNLPWLLTPVRYSVSDAETHYNEAHGRSRRVIERTFGLLKARSRCHHVSGGGLLYSPQKVCKIIVACYVLNKLALRRRIPLLADGEVAAGPVGSDGHMESDEEADEDDAAESRTELINQYFQ
ncbi:putative nuclease HARBI1 [Pleurodeles waltl]|uniref:putative nuclease HARBI1 n=1 Tax=Pleurodeles waltl TaxID=8319 RepID=UPI003709C267